MKQLDARLYNNINWSTLRKNPLEQISGPEQSYDGIVNTYEGHEVIIEFTNSYTFQTDNSIKEWEIFKRNSNVETGYKTNPPKPVFPTKQQFLENLIKACERKNNKKYAENNQQKILVIEISGMFINIFFMKEYKSNMKEFMKDFRMLINSGSINKFDEIIIRTYPDQQKEEILVIGANIWRDDIHISQEHGYIKKHYGN